MIEHALNDMRGALEVINMVDTLSGRPELHERDETWKERAGVICLRASLLSEWADRDDLDSMEIALNALGAHILAMKMAILAVREMRLP
jgi:hypothetical protein